jgi:signal transduction histidine kinase/CheY-like chemotaxis protein
MAIAPEIEIYTAQIRAVYEHIPMVLAVNIVNSALVALVLASYMEQTRWWIFFGSVVALTGVRAAGWSCFRYYYKAPENTRFWAILATAGSALSGLLWGIFSTLLLPDNIVEQTFFAFVVGGMCAGALVSLSYYLPAYIAYTYSSALPLAAGFLLEGRTVYVAMGCMAVVFVAAITFAAHHFNRAFVSGLRLNLDLSERTDELIVVNTRLQAEITQREAAESQLHQARKMEAVGQLTGGIAHDFNNLLTAVLGNIELIEQAGQGDQERIRRLAAAARHAAERGATLTQRLLAFSRRQALRPQNTDVNQLVSAISDLLRSTLGERIAIATILPSGLWPAFVDPNQLENTLINLALNARDAMPGGGTLTIETGNVYLDERYKAAHPDEDVGEYVMLAVTDTGTGMSAEVIERAFEPFFTTKPSGSGTGLGLSQVYGFVGQSKGHITLESEPGTGTSVKIYLPRLAGMEQTAVKTPVGRELAPMRATVLVVEDDNDVREYIVSALTQLGHSVLQAREPGAALSVIDCHPEVDILVTDIGLPGISGRQLADEARRRRGGIRTLFISGYAEDAVLHDRVFEPDVELLSKPFTMSSLAQKIGQVLQHPH